MRNIADVGLGDRSEIARLPPPAETFSVETRSDGHRVLIVPRGELDMATIDEVGAAIDELVVGGFATIRIDLRETSFIDSTGLCLLLRQTRRPDADIAVIDGPEAVSRVFDLAGIRHAVRFEAAP